jgi:integrase/recombinase XerD
MYGSSFGIARQDPIMLLSEAIAHYLDMMAPAGRSPCTIRNARSSLRELAGFLCARGVCEIKGLTREELLAYCAQLSRRSTPKGVPLCVASQCEYLGAVRAFCRWLVWEGWLGADPMLRIPQLRRRRQLPRALLELEEVALLCSLPDMYSYAGCRDRLILEVLYSVANLDLVDLDMREGCLFVRHGKNEKDRVVPIGVGVCRLLERYLAEVRPKWPGMEECPRLFLNRFGRAMLPSAVWHIVRKYVRRAGITKRVSTHTFRHSCATHMVRAGVPIRHLQELLGHSSLETTQIYAHVAIGDLKRAHRRYHPWEGADRLISPAGLLGSAPCRCAGARPRR